MDRGRPRERRPKATQPSGERRPDTPSSRQVDRLAAPQTEGFQVDFVQLVQLSQRQHDRARGLGAVLENGSNVGVRSHPSGQPPMARAQARPKRGKQRLQPKPKRPSAVKRAVLEERERQRAGEENAGATADRSCSAEETVAQRAARQRALPPVQLHGEHRIQSYCDQILTSEMDQLVAALLSKLATFQARLDPSEPNYKLRRRFVHGLRQAQAAVEANRAILVIIVPDVEPSGATDNAENCKGMGATLSRLTELSRQPTNKATVVFALNRRKLARALGLSSHKKASIVAVYSVDGAHDVYVQVRDLSKSLHEQFESEQERSDRDVSRTFLVDRRNRTATADFQVEDHRLTA
ncbi:Selenocysteine insertion sequence-binding protein 2 [Porphyridium purpureum]|uniref:Selenocysteine insertion sequence-binding protein 2 n=1 Tax=Porphyridium purpureum TaxID=35688 RepID=A0A5J4YXK3_PORPP|nr:Selenocysteine insertion sequence-binding protein 2 [Porphyridium purpureum]|eukprot:POR2258..scf209_3